MSGVTDEFIVSLARDLEYVGFSTAEFRIRVFDAGWSAADVAKALITYIMMGNNASQVKRVERAANPEKAREIVSWLASKEVKKNAKQGNPITLGRLAKAYAPALILLRRKLAAEGKIRLQFPTSTPEAQADIALLGYEGTALCRDSRDYVEKFGIIISKVAFPALSESELRLRNEGFAKIARDGLDRDPLLKEMLNTAGLTDLNEALKLLHSKPRPAVPAATTKA